MIKTPEDLEWLIHEALTQLGWEGNVARVAAKLWRLNKGLPREDEFSILSSWLGKCELVHKLDQKQTPPVSSERYQVPDLLVVYRVKDRLVPVLVEVKSSKQNVLSFRPDYLAKLHAYAELIKLPLIFAWKHYGVWTVFDSTRFQKARQNFNIDFATAMSENLLGLLAGDFSYSLSRGTGLHLRFRKEELLQTTKTDKGFTEEWKMICDDVSFTNGSKQVFHDLPTDVQALFSTWDLQDSEVHTPTHITKSFIAKNEYETAVFAHMALVRLLDWNLPAGDKIDWRAMLSKSKIFSGLEDFTKAVQEALKLGIVHHVIHQIPRTQPEFLKAT